MAKPDWGTLQQQFLTEHAKSGIPLKSGVKTRDLITQQQGDILKGQLRNLRKRNCALRTKKNAQKSLYVIAQYQLRRVENMIVRTMMKIPLMCATTGLMTHKSNSLTSILST